MLGGTELIRRARQRRAGDDHHATAQLRGQKMGKPPAQSGPTRTRQRRLSSISTGATSETTTFSSASAC
ncbi:MAG: hypothetical protein ACLSCX_03225 [Oscillospiraceae bacterium]